MSVSNEINNWRQTCLFHETTMTLQLRDVYKVVDAMACRLDLQINEASSDLQQIYYDTPTKLQFERTRFDSKTAMPSCSPLEHIADPLAKALANACHLLFREAEARIVKVEQKASVLTRGTMSPRHLTDEDDASAMCTPAASDLLTFELLEKFVARIFHPYLCRLTCVQADLDRWAFMNQ